MKKRIFMPISVIVFLFIIYTTFQLVRFSDGYLHIIFCDVGQGDAALIRTPTGKDILIDGGPDSSVEQCLAKYMPFWDRNIELMMVSHPQIDHFGGFLGVANQYIVEIFVEPGASGEAKAWKQLKNDLAKQGTQIKTVEKGKTIRFGDISFVVLNPYDAVEQSKKDINNESIVGVLSYKDFDLLFTGDVLPEAIDSFDGLIPVVEVLKVPHHGSKNGLTKEMLEASSPQLAIISSGKGNKFGHPHKQALEILKDTKTLRTDMVGSIEIVSDGKKFWVTNR